jgi:hypothetical protein
VSAESDISPHTAAPDWAMVPFAVACARCGQDLRGRSEPVCPQCGLQFDWAEAVPIEQLTCAQCGYRLYGLTEPRCPECGRPFTWQGALAEYHRRQHFLFEYRWRDGPLRSLVATWFHALRPRRFWKRISLHDPPNVRGLVAMVAVLLAVYFAAMPVSLSLATWGAVQLQTGAGGWAVPGLGWWLVEILTSDEPYVWLGVVATWCLASLGALLVFRQSMRRYRVRVPQVVRVWAYAVPLLPPVCPLLLGGLVFAYNTSVWFSVASGRWFTGACYGGVVLLVLYVVWCLAHAYRHYLRMRHALAVAVAAQTIACLATLTLLAVAEPYWIDMLVTGVYRVLCGP